MSKGDELYREAMECIADLVDEVIERCDYVAEINHFEEQWVLENFRNTLNKEMRNKKGE